MINIKQLRSFRILGIALFDIIMSLIGLFFLFRYAEFKNPFLWTVLFMFPITIVTHRLVGVPTKLNYYLGLSKNPQ